MEAPLEMILLLMRPEADGGGTVTRTWSFAEDAEGFAKSGGSSARISVAWEGTAGAPAGCLRFAKSGTYADSTADCWAWSPELTWEDLGVPAGATVTGVRLTEWHYNRTGANYDLVSLWVRVVNADTVASVTGTSGLTYPESGYLSDNSLESDAVYGGYDTDWVDGYTFAAAAPVHEAESASSTRVMLEIHLGLGGVGTEARTATVYVDEVTLEITYE